MVSSPAKKPGWQEASQNLNLDPSEPTNSLSVPVFFFGRRKISMLLYCLFGRNLIRVITFDDWSLFDPETNLC